MNRMTSVWMCILGVFASVDATAGTVTTLADLQANGGVTLDSVGDIYAADFGGLNAPPGPRNVWKLSPTGAFSPFIFATGINVASGNDFDSQDNLFQSNFGSNQVSKIDSAGVVTTFSTTVNGPIGIVIDENDTLFVSNCNGNTISQITAQGTATLFSTSGLLNCPNGITRDEGGNLYVINFNDGRIIRIAPDQTVTVFAAVAAAGGHLTIARGRLFATSFGGHQITAFPLSGANAGTAVLTIGSGQASSLDGSLTGASFNSPNGITADLAGENLYVTDIRGVRRIALEEPDIGLSRESIDFPAMTVGETVVESVQIVNNGVGELTLSSIDVALTDGLSISADSCTATTLATAETCSLSLTFSPAMPGVLDVTLNITSNDPERSAIALPVTGMVMAIPAPNLVSLDDVDFGDLMTGVSDERELTLTNDGILVLNVTSLGLVEVSGTPVSAMTENFSVTQICSSVQAGNSCVETLSFHPQSSGSKSAVLAIVTDDPDTPSIDVSVQATASDDSDGIFDAIEDGAANGGDGNSDGTLDRQQPDVTSLPDTNGTYLTLVSVDNLEFEDVTVVVNPSPQDAPTGVTFDQGFMTFSIRGAPATPITVDLILSDGATPDSYFIYGPEPGNTQDHWFDFAFDTTTGAQFSGNTVSLQLADGARGDLDLTVNGVIVVVGGTATTPPPPPPAPPPPVPTPSSGGGTMGWISFFALLVVLPRRKVIATKS